MLLKTTYAAAGAQNSAREQILRRYGLEEMPAATPSSSQGRLRNSARLAAIPEQHEAEAAAATVEPGGDSVHRMHCHVSAAAGTASAAKECT